MLINEEKNKPTNPTDRSPSLAADARKALPFAWNSKKIWINCFDNFCLLNFDKKKNYFLYYLLRNIQAMKKKKWSKWQFMPKQYHSDQFCWFLILSFELLLLSLSFKFIYSLLFLLLIFLINYQKKKSFITILLQQNSKIFLRPVSIYEVYRNA